MYDCVNKRISSRKKSFLSKSIMKPFVSKIYWMINGNIRMGGVCFIVFIRFSNVSFFRFLVDSYRIHSNGITIIYWCYWLFEKKNRMNNKTIQKPFRRSAMIATHTHTFRFLMRVCKWKKKNAISWQMFNLHFNVFFKKWF